MGIELDVSNSAGMECGVSVSLSAISYNNEVLGQFYWEYYFSVELLGEVGIYDADIGNTKYGSYKPEKTLKLTIAKWWRSISFHYYSR